MSAERDAVILAIAKADGQESWPEFMDPRTAEVMYGAQADAAIATVREQVARDIEAWEAEQYDVFTEGAWSDGARYALGAATQIARGGDA